MNKERWQLVEKTYHAALEREGEARAAFLIEARESDEELRREVETLIAQDVRSSAFRRKFVAPSAPSGFYKLPPEGRTTNASPRERTGHPSPNTRRLELN